jgi:hypothetical protein
MFLKHRNNGATYWVPDAPDSSGLEVIEDDPESSWNLWQSAVAEQAGKSPGAPSAPHVFDQNQNPNHNHTKPAGANRSPKAG